MANRHFDFVGCEVCVCFVEKDDQLRFELGRRETIVLARLWSVDFE